MKRINRLILSVFILVTVLITGCGGGSDSKKTATTDDSLSAEQKLGKKLFFDDSLSSEGNQSCADRHSPASGFADPVATQNAPVSEGSVAGEFGNRNAPTSSYANFIPSFTKKTSTTADGTTSLYQGGQFLDGRAVDLVEQAKGPFLNPVEMNNNDAAEVVSKVELASYADDFIAVYGATAFDNVDTAYHNIATAIASFEDSTEMSPFTSKFDAWQKGETSFTNSEERGFELFKGNKAKCANCHTVSNPPTESLFTDFNYFNIGVPVNFNNPSKDTDIGLAANPNISAVDVDGERGKFRTPTLRNIAETAPYMHNGVYATLEEVIRHYDITVADYIDEPTLSFFPPEVDINIAEEVKTRLGLSPQDYTDLENFLNTLSDI